MNKLKIFFSTRGFTGSLYVFAFGFLFSFAGCADDTYLGLPPQHSNPPAPPTIVGEPLNLNGASIIYFAAPASNDVIAVTATYDINGVERVVKASVFAGYLMVEGFGKRGDYKVYLRTVDKHRNESTPVEVTVSPLESPVEMIFESLEIIPNFGGIRVSWKNEVEAEIIVGVSVKDEFGDWVGLENFYSSAAVGQGRLMGMDPEPVTVGVTIRDRWDNFSPMQEITLTPLFHEQLPKRRFREVPRLPNDAPHMASPRTPTQIWSDNYAVDAAYHTDSNLGIGMFVTFDMGQIAKLSQYIMWDRIGGSNQFIYTHNNLRRYTIYGALEITDEMRETGTIDGWTHIYDALAYRPSGLPPGVAATTEDIEYARNIGDLHEIPIEAPPVRFIRIHFLENWSGGTIAQIRQMDFWGEIHEAIFN